MSSESNVVVHVRGADLFRGIKGLISDKAWDDAVTVVSGNSDNVCGPAFNTLGELLTAHGTNDESVYEELAGVEGAANRANVLLDTGWSWGEFVGSVMASFPKLPPDERDAIREHLEEALRRIVESGGRVDS